MNLGMESIMLDGFKKLILRYLTVFTTICISFTWSLPSYAQNSLLLNPYQTGEWILAVNGGGAPTFYEGSTNSHSYSQVIPGRVLSFPLASFDNQYGIPYVIEAEAGYLFVDNMEVFLDFDYNHASGKFYSFNLAGTLVGQDYRPFSFDSYAGYIGTRYYFNYFCTNIVPFAGFKVGYIHRDGGKVNAYLNGVPFPNNPLSAFQADDSVSGGIQVGTDFNISSHFAFKFKVEVLAAGSRGHMVVLNPFPIPNAVSGQTGVLLSIPITLGLVYHS